MWQQVSVTNLQSLTKKNIFLFLKYNSFLEYDFSIQISSGHRDSLFGIYICLCTVQCTVVRQLVMRRLGITYTKKTSTVQQLVLTHFS